MNNKNFVKRLLLKHDAYFSPVNIQRVIENFDILVLPKDLKTSVSGMLITKKDGDSVIVINENHSGNRKKFSLAHEFSHYLLHRDKADVFVDDVVAFFRDNNSSTGEDLKERQANQLAAELLMPEDLLKEKVGDRIVDLHDSERIDKLAGLFEVSQQAMTFRLKNLNLLYSYGFN